MEYLFIFIYFFSVKGLTGLKGFLAAECENWFGVTGYNEYYIKYMHNNLILWKYTVCMH